MALGFEFADFGAGSRPYPFAVTAPLALANFQGRFDVNIAQLTAAAVIVALPIVVLYVALQRRFLVGVERSGGR